MLLIKQLPKFFAIRCHIVKRMTFIIIVVISRGLSIILQSYLINNEQPIKIHIIILTIPDRVAVIVFGILTLIAGVLFSSIPWLDYFILKVSDYKKTLDFQTIYIYF